MADQRIKSCDSKSCARRGKTVERYKIEMPGLVFQADLCKEHAAPLRDFSAGFPPHFMVRLRPGGRSTGIRIHTLEDIERLKGEE